ncbi:MAG: DUF2971 domain-containing protein [Sphingopyxis sp.]
MMTSSKNLYRRYTSLPVLIDMLVSKRITIVGYDSWADANDRYSMDSYKSLNPKVTFLGAYCVAKSTNQTYHQWKVFADGQSGVCIVFDASKFENFCASLDSTRYICRDVKYIPYMSSKNEQDKKLHEAFVDVDRCNLPFAKRSGFSAEKEFRILYSSTDRDEKIHHIDFDTSMIAAVILSPSLPDGLLSSVKSTLKSIDGCPKSVTKARLLDSRAWQQSLDRYAAKTLGSA